MNRIKIITKYFIKNAIQEMFPNKKKGSWDLIAVMIFCIIALSAPFATMVVGSYDTFQAIGQEGILLSTILFSGSSIAFFFGIYTVMNVFYFSNDVEEILPLPFKSSEIVFGKFISVLINIYIYIGILVLPLIAYGVVSKSSFIYYLYAIIVLIITPILPMVLASLISMALMRFTSLSKHKDAFRMFSGCSSLVLIVVFNFFTNSSRKNMSLEEIINTITNGNNSLMNSLTGIFVTNKFSVYGLLYNNELKGLLYTIIALILSIVIFIIYYYIGGKLYLKGIIGISESYSKRENVLEGGKVNSLIKTNSPIKALIMKDIKVIFRTPQFFINCVAMIFYMPAIMGLALLSGGQLSILRDLLVSNTKWYGIAIVVAFISGAICVIGGGAGMTALSREGKDFMISKYIPIDYKTLIHSKILSSLCVNELGAVIVAIILILLKVSPFLFILGILCASGAILLITLLGIYIDFKSPRLDWEDEKSMFKNNYMPLLMVLLIFILGALLLAMAFIIKNYIIIFIISIIICIVPSFFLYKSLVKLANKIYNE